MGGKYFGSAEALVKLLGIMLEGARVSVLVFLLTLILSLPLGVLVALARMNRRGLVWRPLAAYIWIMRGTPLMLQIFFCYYFLPAVLPFKIDRFWAVILAFTLNYAAYFGEIFRGGIQSIARGQYEAAQVLGFTRAATFMRIILPQVIKRVLLPVGGEVITLVKDTALAGVVALAELMRVTKNMVSSSASVEPYLIAAIIYLLFNGVASRAVTLVEKRLDYYQ